MIAVGGEEGVGEWWEEGEGTSQRTCMSDSWTWTRERGERLWERGVGWVEAGKREKNWDNCNRIKNKKVEIIKNKYI